MSYGFSDRRFGIYAKSYVYSDIFDIKTPFWWKLQTQSCFWAKSCVCCSRTAANFPRTFETRFEKFRVESTLGKMESCFVWFSKYIMWDTPFRHFFHDPLTQPSWPILTQVWVSWVRILLIFRISVRFSLVGIPSRACQPKLPVWAVLESTLNLELGRVLPGKFGYFSAVIHASTEIRARPSRKNRAEACIPAPKYPNIPGRTRPDPKFCVDSKSAPRFDRTARNHELRARPGNFGPRGRLGIPTEPNRTNIRDLHKILTWWYPNSGQDQSSGLS